ncbi:MAG: hypothetical protein AB7G93_20855 [Bdellovibrionales bacterium]
MYQPGGDIYGEIDKRVSELIDKIGPVNGEKTRLGFMIILPVWAASSGSAENENQIKKIIGEAFTVAKKRNVAAYFTLYSAVHYMPDLWNWFDPSQAGYDPDNKNNVEWTDWSGTPTKARYSLQEGETRQPPVMCYNSPKILSEVSRITSKIIGPALMDGINDLKNVCKEDLFAGITLSEELSLDDYSVIDQLNPKLGEMMTQDGALKTRLGYCALTNLGYSQSNPPADYPAALARINQQYSAYWGKQLVQAGLSKDKLYTHVAPAIDELYLRYTNAPIETAFNEYSTAGWTTYLIDPLVSTNGFQPLYDALKTEGLSRWAATETSPTNLTSSSIGAEKYLAWHFNRGAVVMVINSADESPGGQAVGRDIWASQSVAAYRKFLNGEQLKD